MQTRIECGLDDTSSFRRINNGLPFKIQTIAISARLVLGLLGPRLDLVGLRLSDVALGEVVWPGERPLESRTK